jgi:CRISPR/Cas system-associated exonuclease Cas4 (RecB family)
MKKYHIKAKPLAHDRMDEWRDSLRRGIRYLHEPTNFLVTGGIDDVWVNDKGELIIVDYKATSKKEEINLDDGWKKSYKRQMEVYQWLFRQNGFKVSDTGYFVYANGRTDKKAFDKKLEFDVTILSYKGKDDWVEKALVDARQCLESDEMPNPGKDCDFCLYRRVTKDIVEVRKR